MTEQEWENEEDPLRMLAFLLNGGKASDRKLRLLCCACCRRVWRLVSDKRARKAVRLSEQYADEQITERAMRAAIQAAWFKPPTANREGSDSQARFHAWKHFHIVAFPDMSLRGSIHEAVTGVIDAVSETEMVEGTFAPCVLVRELFGPLPFRPLTIDHSVLHWNDGCVAKLAAGIYEDRNFSEERMGVLGDALEESGVADEVVLGHCRQPEAVHGRGCWLVDLLLNKE